MTSSIKDGGGKRPNTNFGDDVTTTSSDEKVKFEGLYISRSAHRSAHSYRSFLRKEAAAFTSHAALRNFAASQVAAEWESGKPCFATMCGNAALRPKVVLCVESGNPLVCQSMPLFVALSHGSHSWSHRGGRSHFFRLRLRSCSKTFESESGSGNLSNLRIRILFRLRLPSIQPKFTNAFTLRNDRTDSCCCRNWRKLAPDPFFHKFLTPAPEERRILPESTPALRIYGHLWHLTIPLRKVPKIVSNRRSQWKISRNQVAQSLWMNCCAA